jgi:hypothetical protein
MVRTSVDTGDGGFDPRTDVSLPPASGKFARA